MPDELTALVADRIASELPRINGLNDAELLASLASWLDGQTGEGLYAGDPADRFHDWLQATVLPYL